MELDVLYACDENYAPFAGVSITSLFMSNPDLDRIRVYIVVDKVSQQNRDRYLELARSYGREVVLIDASEMLEQIKALHIPMWRNSYATNYRLFFSRYIAPDVERLLYLDCDTLIVGSLRPLLEMDMGKNCIGMVHGSGQVYADRVLDYKAPYNAGVALFNVKAWREGHWEEKLVEHARNVRARYQAPDQDLLNIVCAGHILRLPPQYNFPPIHRVLPDDIYFKAARASFYRREEIQNAREHPVILHTYRFLGEFPWHEGTLHPDKGIFDSYLGKSLWKDYKRKPSPQDPTYRIERLIYRYLPKSVFFKAFNTAQLLALYMKNRELKHEEKKQG